MANSNSIYWNYRCTLRELDAYLTSKSSTKILLKYGWAEKDHPPMEEPEAAQKEIASSSSSDKEEVMAARAQPKAAAWVVTRPAGAKTLGCLHVIGRCHRVPGVHFKDWVEVCEGADKTLFTKACNSASPSASRSSKTPTSKP